MKMVNQIFNNIEHLQITSNIDNKQVFYYENKCNQYNRSHHCTSILST